MPNFFDKYPYTDFHELNLDWIIKTVKETVAEWAVTLTEWHNTQEEWENLYNYVHDYFDNLDVQQEINNKLDQMALDGSLAAIAQPIIEARVAQLMPGEVSTQIGGAVASQIGSTVAGQIGPVVADQLPSVAPSIITGWMNDHITQPTTPIVDTSLSISGAAADAQVTGNELNKRLIVSPTYNDLSDFNLVTENSIHIFNALCNGGNIANEPFVDWRNGACWELVTVKASGYVWQYLYCQTRSFRSASRQQTSGVWGGWNLTEAPYFTEWLFNSLADCNAIRYNCYHVFNAETNGGSLANAPFTDWQDGSLWVLETIETNLFVTQRFRNLNEGSSSYRSAIRYYDKTMNAWHPWDIALGDVLTINIGPGQTYTTLKAGFAASYGRKCHIIVHPGTYDLATEFATELANHDASANLKLGYGSTYTFMAGSYVTCLLDGSDAWAYDYFEPFVVRQEDFTIDGLNIQASNTKYCIHDECGGSGTYKHVYNNCIMKYTSVILPQKYSQCIGGGMGEHAYIEINGGMYESDPADTNYIEPISYHNGSGATCDGKIFIHNVYLVGAGSYMRFGWYGASTIVTPVIVSGCSMGAAIKVQAETPGWSNINFELTEWNNTVR